jgi:MFS family permease
MENVGKKKTSGKVIVFGIFLATFFCSLSGQINDFITVKYLPIEFGGDSVMYGFTFSMFSLGRILTMIIFARLSDRIGRKKILILAFLLYSFGTFLAGIAQTPTQFMIFRLIKGTSAFEGVMLALINDYYKEGERGKAIAIYSASFGIGALIGSILGGFFLIWFEYKITFYILGFISMLSILFVFLCITNHPDQIIELEKKSSQNIKLDRKNELKRIFKTKNFIYGLIINTFLMFCLSGVSTYMIFIVLNHYLIPEQLSGAVLFPVIFSYILFALLMGKKENPIRIIRYGLIILTISLSTVIILKFYDSLIIFIIGAGISSSALGAISPAVDNYISSFITKSVRGETLGIYRSLSLIGSLLGAITAGYLGTISWIFSPFLVMALIALISFLVSWYFLK